MFALILFFDFTRLTSFLALSFFFKFFLDAELDALEADIGTETESDAVPSYLQPDKEHDLDAELNLPAAPSGNAVPPNRHNAQVLPVSS